MWRLSDFWKCDVALGTPPLEKAQEALTALTVFLPFPGPPSAPIPIPVPWYWMHWRCARSRRVNKGYRFRKCQCGTTVSPEES
ncbi:hypothetical protein J6590_031341 [Homalodisca vitripennis]|nr:hypothetical protein J6590_031341 [Homalodisca vitripennis]